MKKILMTASTYSHFHHFHRPYFLALSQQGYQVDIACPFTSTDQKPEGVHTMHQIPFQKSILSRNNLKATIKLRTLIKNNNYTTLITHTTLAACFTRLATIGLQTTLINVVHGYLFHETSPFLEKHLYQTVEKLLAPQTTRILTMNQWDYTYATTHKLAKEIHIINGIGLPPIDPNTLKSQGLRESLKLPPNTYLLLYGAEYSKRKNQTFLIEAMKHLPETVHLALAGTNTEKLAPLITTNHLTNRIHLLGKINNLPSWYQTADLIVSSSKSEGLPMHLLEALTLNKPLLVSKTKGNTDLTTPDQQYTNQTDFINKVKSYQQNQTQPQQKDTTPYKLETLLPTLLPLYTTPKDNHI